MQPLISVRVSSPCLLVLCISELWSLPETHLGGRPKNVHIYAFHRPSVFEARTGAHRGYSAPRAEAGVSSARDPPTYPTDLGAEGVSSFTLQEPRLLAIHKRLILPTLVFFSFLQALDCFHKAVVLKHQHHLEGL